MRFDKKYPNETDAIQVATVNSAFGVLRKAGSKIFVISTSQAYVLTADAEASKSIASTTAKEEVGIGASVTTDKLILTERSDAPATPAEGTMYVDSDTNKLMVYLGGAWETVTSAVV